ncbi:hypothetical protein PUV47_11675 [Pseudovibrio exalbescens]|uniref:hypothetical protein n=1 Tax=Pseudovibrio exalbescens TaxID=197461 RepID=UPI0023660496|nr:hypothetical protein [Pseudovibrio exalbescens]MDD7910580.1 hypothetical protein [Pseudovibrio exalbescens]
MTSRYFFILLLVFSTVESHSSPLLQVKRGLAQLECSALSSVLEKDNYTQFLLNGVSNLRTGLSAAVSDELSEKEKGEFIRIFEIYELGLTIDIIVGAIWASTNKSIQETLPKPDWNIHTFDSWKSLQQKKATQEYIKRNCEILTK